MKKRLLSMVLTVIMLVSLIPTSVFAAKKSVDDYFDGLPIAADPGAGTTAWKVSTKDGEEVLMSGNAGKNYSSSTLTLTFTEDTHLSFEYKVSSEAKYDKCTITLGSTTLVDGESGDKNWKGLELDAKRGDKLTVRYEKDSSGNKFDDCVYLRNFSAGEALVVTFHANNGTEDTATQKIFGGKGTLKANTFTCEGKIFAGWATSADGAVVYEDGPPSPRRRIWSCTPCGRTLTPSRSATATPTPPFWSPRTAPSAAVFPQTPPRRAIPSRAGSTARRS